MDRVAIVREEFHYRHALGNGSMFLKFKEGERYEVVEIGGRVRIKVERFGREIHIPYKYNYKFEILKVDNAQQ